MGDQWTKHTFEEVVDAAKKGHTKQGAAYVLGVTRGTVQNYCKRWPILEGVFLEQRAEMVDLAEAGLRGAIIAQQPWAITFALKTLGRDLYSERIEHSGPNGKAVRFTLRLGPDDDDPDIDQGAGGDWAGVDTPGTPLLEAAEGDIP